MPRTKMNSRKSKYATSTRFNQRTQRAKAYVMGALDEQLAEYAANGELQQQPKLIKREEIKRSLG